ncbi:hypothetical protein BSNK01_28430 [Bacillaceae bacterium]
MAKITARIEEAYRRKEEEERSEKKRQERENRKQQLQAKLAALAEKQKQGKLTLEDIDAKLDLIIEMLSESR